MLNASPLPDPDLALILGAVVAGSLGLLLLGEGLGLSTKGLKRWAGAICVVTVALILGRDILVGVMGLKSPGSRELRVGRQNPDRFEVSTEGMQVKVGRQGEGGQLGVRSRQPEGDDAGATLSVKGPGAYDLGLDHRLSDRPRLISTSPRPLDVVTPSGVDLELNPGSIVRTEAAQPGRAVTRVRGRLLAEGRRTLTIDPEHGVVVLPDGDAISRRPASGTLRLIGGRLVVGRTEGDGR